jgi:Legionella pneumophila major outer membrane protein precursor
MDVKLRAAFLCLALSVAPLSQAAMYTPPKCTKGHDVLVPCEGFGWYLGVQGLYLRQFNDDLTYQTTTYGVVGGDTPSTRTTALVSNYDYGFRLDAGVRFRQGMILRANWSRINSSTKRGFKQVPMYHFPPPIPAIPAGTVAPRFFNGFYDNVIGKAHYDFDQVNLQLGQLASLGDEVRLMILVGAQYVKLDHKFKITGYNNTNTGYINITDKSDFDGFGPSVTFKGKYHLGGPVSAFGSVTTAALISDIDESLHTVGEFDGPVNTHKHHCTKRTVVPSADFNLGMMVSYPVGDFGHFALKGGWHVGGVFHAISHDGSISNYGQAGPFLGASLVG